MTFYLKKLCAIFVFCFAVAHAETLFLRDQIQRANPGDFIVTLRDNAFTFLRIHERSSSSVTMEEISVPMGRIPTENFSWREWIRQGAPQSTSWVRYKVVLPRGNITSSYALSAQGWYAITLSDVFLPTLLNLPFSPVPDTLRKRTGSNKNMIWNPPMVVDGKRIPNVAFDVWKALWPKDGSVLSNKTIEVYLPHDNNSYPSHFPYWLQIQGGVIGNTQVRIIDSGKGLDSSAPPNK